MGRGVNYPLPSPNYVCAWMPAGAAPPWPLIEIYATLSEPGPLTQFMPPCQAQLNQIEICIGFLAPHAQNQFTGWCTLSQLVYRVVQPLGVSLQGGVTSHSQCTGWGNLSQIVEKVVQPLIVSLQGGATSHSQCTATSYSQSTGWCNLSQLLKR